MNPSRKSKNTILVIDSDPYTYKILTLVLDKNDFQVIECRTAAEAIRVCASIKPNIILLDLLVEDMNGIDVIKSIREWSELPVIIISAKQASEDIIHGLNLGADDYVIKPFNVDVLRARVNASLRKSAVHETGEPQLCNGYLRMDLVRHEVFLEDSLVAFTPKEYNLLRYFMVHCGKMLGHREILNEVWGSAHSDDTQYLRVFIGQIREKIEKDPAHPVIITTELGIGYRMEFLNIIQHSNQNEIRI